MLTGAYPQRYSRVAQAQSAQCRIQRLQKRALLHVLSVGVSRTAFVSALPHYSLAVEQAERLGESGDHERDIFGWLTREERNRPTVGQTAEEKFSVARAGKEC